MKKILTFLLCMVLLLVVQSNAQTTLSAGGIAIDGYNSDDDGSGNDDFSFVLLTNVLANTTIHFTDFGWVKGTFTGFHSANPPCNPASQGATADGAITWTTPTALQWGTRVRIVCKKNLSASVGTVSGLVVSSGTAGEYISLATGGETLFAFQGSLASPVLITALNMNGAWDATFDRCEFNSAKSTLPDVLSTANTVLVNPERNNAVYTGSYAFGSADALKTAIFNPTNWAGNDGARYTLPYINPVLPVTLSRLTASISSSNLLQVKWETKSEKNNKHFIVQGSVNGSKWTDLGTVSSKSANGNSDTALSYTFTKSIGGVALAGFGLLGLLLLPAVRSRIGRVAMFGLVIVAIASCAKDRHDGVEIDDQLKTGQAVYVRILQVDFDGNIDYSDIIMPKK